MGLSAAPSMKRYALPASQVGVVICPLVHRLKRSSFPLVTDGITGSNLMFPYPAGSNVPASDGSQIDKDNNPCPKCQMCSGFGI